MDGEGVAVDLAHAAAHRAVTEIEPDGRPIAALVHDASLGEHSVELVHAAGRATAVWIEPARLEAERGARLVELRDSRARLVEATDAERRIERDLHDGAQQRLAGLLLDAKLRRRAAQTPADADALLDDLEHGLAGALAELRALAAGILPPVLTDHGLAAAVEELAARSPVPVTLHDGDVARLAPGVEAAGYFVVAEALANVIKHARAQQVDVRLMGDGAVLAIEIADDGVGGAAPEHGRGLRGLADRVGALDGTFGCTSTTEGTVVRAEIPCAS